MHQQQSSLVRHLKDGDTRWLVFAVLPQPPVHVVMELKQSFTTVDKQLASTLEVEIRKVEIIAMNYSVS